MDSDKIISGKALAEQILGRLSDQISEHVSTGKRAPGLATILVGNDPASEIYIRNKTQKAKLVGIHNSHYALKENISQADLLALVQKLNKSPDIDGILIQLPLPKHIDSAAVLCAINPLKDVDGFHPENVGLLSIGTPRLIPCTPKGCMALLEHRGIELKSKHVVVIGRSNIVGKPMVQLLLNSDATVTVCHQGTLDLGSYTRRADVIITATGSPHLIGPEMVKKGCVILDIGITRMADGKIVGDADTQALLPTVSAITPVPGGVGPMTLAMLMENTYQAYKTTGP